MSGNAEDDLSAEQTAGFKLGEKKTIDEYQQLESSLSSIVDLYELLPDHHLPSPCQSWVLGSTPSEEMASANEPESSGWVTVGGGMNDLSRSISMYSVESIPLQEGFVRIARPASAPPSCAASFVDLLPGGPVNDNDNDRDPLTYKHYVEKQKLTRRWVSDQNDESLRKWKQSLGLGTGTPLVDESNPNHCILLSLGLEVEGRPDIIIDLTAPGAVDKLVSKPFTIKEGALFRMKVRFRVQHQILSGMKYIQVVKRMGLSAKTQEMIGSYSPNTTDKPEYEKKFEADTAPSGTLGRGSYKAVSRFVDDDKHTHLQFEWTFEVKKDW